MLSIVIPVFNAADSLTTLHRELSEVAAAEGYDLDVVTCVDERIKILLPPPTANCVPGKA